MQFGQSGHRNSDLNHHHSHATHLVSWPLSIPAYSYPTRRPLYWVYPTTHGTTRSQRLALTSPRSTLQHSDSCRLSHLHKSLDLSTSFLALGHRWVTGRNHRRRQGWTGIHGWSRRLPLNPRRNGTGRALHLSRSNLGRLSKHSSSATRLLPDRGRDWSGGN